jgi:hypothetical protein
MTENLVPERYFYHSFPRRGAVSEAEAEKGCKILAAIRDFGLLLTPQQIEWKQPTSDGSERILPVLQSRVCFTELSPHELPLHAVRFGRFALEFDIETVRSLGAVPVFYIPQPTGTDDAGSAVATALLAIVRDAYVVVNRMANLDRIFKGPQPVAEKINATFGFASSPGGEGQYTLDHNEAKNFLAAVGHAVTPWIDLDCGMQAVLNFFHPTDNSKSDRTLEYYREREWRIAGNFTVSRPDGSRVEVMHMPTAEERARFMEIDPEFFSRKIVRDIGDVHTLDEALVYPGLAGRRIIDMVRRVIVPASAVDQARAIIDGLPKSPPVVSIDEILDAGSK